MKPPSIRNRNWLDELIDELFAEINVRFWQLVVISILLGVAVGIAFAMAG